MTTANTGKYGRVNPGPGYGKQYDYTANAVLTADQDGALVTNIGAVAAIALTLPAATAGREFAVMRIAAYSVAVTAAGGDNIRSGAAGGSYVINSRVITIFGCLVDGTWEIVLENPQTELNLLAFGAVGDGTTNDSAALAQLFAVLQDGDAVHIPGGKTYHLPDGPFNITKDSITIYSDGMPVLDFAGGPGINLTGDDQSDIICRGLHFRDFSTVAFGIPSNGTQDEVLKKRIIVEGCRFTDAIKSSGSVMAIKLSCETQGCRIANNHIENLQATGTSGNPFVYGIIVGRKGDSITGARPGEAWSYGYGGDILTAEDANHITGNVIRKLRCSGADTADICTGILSDGWRSVISGNTVEDIQYIGAGAIGASGYGIYSRGHDQVITGNTLADCTGGQVVLKDSSSSATYGALGHTVVSNNTFRSLAALAHATGAAYTIINVNNGYVTIANNYFVRCVVASSSGQALIKNADGLPQVQVLNNTFDYCTSDWVANLSGSANTFRGNLIQNHVGPTTAANDFRAVNWYNNAARTGVQIEDNTLIIDEAIFRAGTSYFFVANCDAAVYGLTVRNNKILGWGAGNPAETWSLININCNVDTHETWDISGNKTDTAWRGVDKYGQVSLGTATVWPTPMRLTWDFLGAVTASAAATLTILPDESGAVFANVGAGAAWAYILPVATPGLEFGFSKVVAQAVTVDPNGTDIINAGAAGGILTLTDVGSSVYLKCFVAGTWIVTASNGAYTVA